jgi:hypothetical protein
VGSAGHGKRGHRAESDEDSAGDLHSESSLSFGPQPPSGGYPRLSGEPHMGDKGRMKVLHLNYQGRKCALQR